MRVLHAQCVRRTDALMRAAAGRGEKCGDRLQASVLRVPEPCCAGLLLNMHAACAVAPWPAPCANMRRTTNPFWRRPPAPAAQRGSVTAHSRCRRSMLCFRQCTQRFGLRCCCGVAACASPPEPLLHSNPNGRWFEELRVESSALCCAVLCGAVLCCAVPTVRASARAFRLYGPLLWKCTGCDGLAARRPRTACCAQWLR